MAFSQHSTDLVALFDARLPSRRLQNKSVCRCARAFTPVRSKSEAEISAVLPCTPRLASWPNPTLDEVLVSRVVTDLVAGAGLKFSERGSHELKGLPGRWDLFAASL